MCSHTRNIIHKLSKIRGGGEECIESITDKKRARIAYPDLVVQVHPLVVQFAVQGHVAPENVRRQAGAGRTGRQMMM